MAIVLDGTAGITTPEITSAGGPLVVNASAPDNSVVVDASGNVGIGTSSPTALGAGRTSVNINGSTDAILWLGSNGTYTGYVQGASAACNLVGNGVDLQLSATGAKTISLSTNGAERARIDSSGNLLVGRTSQVQNGQYSADFPGTSKRGAVYNNTDSFTASNFVSFSDRGTVVGTIVQNGASTVNYSTSSDYRLKNTIAPMTGALEKVAALKPCTYKWNADGSDGEGFIAHELAEVCPQAVTGEKDVVDADGNPVYQGIDTSFLVATLTAAIQEQQAIIESLTARVVALEGQAT